MTKKIIDIIFEDQPIYRLTKKELENANKQDKENKDK
jgi:hypothetical protein